MLLLLVSWALLRLSGGSRAIWAVNAGGHYHRSVDGVTYNADMPDMPGVTSDHGIHHVPLLARVHPQVIVYSLDFNSGKILLIQFKI